MSEDGPRRRRVLVPNLETARRSSTKDDCLPRRSQRRAGATETTDMLSNRPIGEARTRSLRVPTRPCLPVLASVALALAAALAAFPTAAEAQRTARVRILHGSDGTEHAVVSRVIGEHLAPYSYSYTSGGYTYYASGLRWVDDIRPVCEAPCDALVPEGLVRFLVDGVYTPAPVSVVDGAILRTDVTKYDFLRALGYVLGLTALLGPGFVALFTVVDVETGQVRDSDAIASLFDSDDEIAAWIGGGVGWLTTVVVASVFCGFGDSARVQVIPGGIQF